MIVLLWNAASILAIGVRSCQAAGAGLLKKRKPYQAGEEPTTDLSWDNWQGCSPFSVKRLMQSSAKPQPVTIAIDDARCVAGLLQAPKDARICYVLEHGAGAGMTHPFMGAVADGLAKRGIATLRYPFPYMEQGSKRPDVPKLAHATVACRSRRRFKPTRHGAAPGRSRRREQRDRR